MNDEQIKNEFKIFKLTEKQVLCIKSLYNNAASLLIETLGAEAAKDATTLKLTINSLKFTVSQILELKGEEGKN